MYTLNKFLSLISLFLYFSSMIAGKIKYEAKNNELKKVYNSKRWQLMEKIDNILKRKK